MNTIILNNTYRPIKSFNTENNAHSNLDIVIEKNNAIQSEMAVDEIVQMTFDELPVALQSLKSDQWMQFGRGILSDMKIRMDFSFRSSMHRIFYDGIYKKASFTVPYEFSKTKNERQQEWETLVTCANANGYWKPAGIKYGRCGHAQMKTNTPEGINQAKVHLRYHRASEQGRLQFVVTSGAGLMLYADLAKVIDKYIDEQYAGMYQLSPVRNFKVFSEDYQVGRSDSAVIYLSVPLSDPAVDKFVTYLNKAIGSRLAPIEVIGATSFGSIHIKGTTIPERSLQIELTGTYTTSHGGLIGNILAKAYELAYEDLLTVKDPDEIEINELNKRAQFYAKEIWNELGMEGA